MSRPTWARWVTRISLVLGIVHDFVGVNHEPETVAAATPRDSDATDVVHRTLRARVERKLADHLVVVGIGAQYQEWFCLDVSKPTSSGEYQIGRAHV